jgi:hypothetical protein
LHPFSTWIKIIHSSIFPVKPGIYSRHNFLSQRVIK